MGHNRKNKSEIIDEIHEIIRLIITEKKNHHRTKKEKRSRRYDINKEIEATQRLTWKKSVGYKKSVY